MRLYHIPNVHNRSTPRTMSQPSVLNNEIVWFEQIVPNQEFHILTLSITFHHTSTSHRDLKIVHDMDIIMGFFNVSVMNKIVGATIID